MNAHPTSAATAPQPSILAARFAYARWLGETSAGCKGARLPTELEWEAAVAPDFAAQVARGNFAESRALHPMPVARAHAGWLQTAGDVWEWTSSSYSAYPG